MRHKTLLGVTMATCLAGCGGSSPGGPGNGTGGVAGTAGIAGTGVGGNGSGGTTGTGPAGGMGSAAAGTTGAAGSAVAGTTGAAGTTATAGTTGAAGAMATAGTGAAGATATGGRTGASGMAGTAGVSGAAGATASDLLVPAQGALLGLYYGAGTIAATDARIGRAPQIHLVYYAFDDDWAQGAKSDLAAGRIPLVNWEPGGVDFNTIVSGAHDATIKARAAGAKALPGKLFLDFAAEMNGDEGWGGNNPTLYIAAYRHIHDLFVAGGATNVVWAWCPNVTDIDNTNKHTLDYYPGDAYVDWTGVDGYNWGGGDWQSFQQVFKNIYPLLASKKKPIIIGEMASDETGGDKAAWIDAMIPTLKAQYPMIKAIVWFDVDKERDWRVNSSTATLAAFSKLAKDPYFNP